MLYLLERASGEHHIALPQEAAIRQRLSHGPAIVHAARCTLHPLDLLEARKVVESVQPDIIAAHTSNAHLTGMLVAGGRPLVVHRRVDFSVQGGLLKRMKYRRPHKYIAVSDAVRQVLVTGGVETSKIDVVHDGVDPPNVSAEFCRTTARDKLSLPSDAFLVVAIGALVPHKGHRVLVDAIHSLRERKHKVRCLIIGEGPERQRLQAQIQQNQLGGVVTLMGHKPDILPILGAADLFCHPSIEEGMGQVILEVMHCGVPIVATSAGGIPELVTDLETAILVAPGRPGVLARAIETCSRGTEASQQRSRRAKKVAHEQFSVNRMVSGTMTAYHSVF
jgi:glycosyltransferase involved in cell wall biosynthesis